MNTISFFIPHSKPRIARSNYEDVCRFFVKTSLLVCLFTSLLALQHYITGTTLAGTINLCISVVCLANLFFFRVIGDLDFSANVLMAFCLIFLCAHILTSNKEYHSYHLIWVGCFPVFASSLLSRKATKIWTFLAFTALGSGVALRHFGYSFGLYEIVGDRLLFSSLFSLGLSLVLIYNLVKNFREKELEMHIASQIVQEDKKHLETALSYNVANSVSSIRLIAEEVLNNQNDSRLIDFSQKILEKLEGVEQVIKNLSHSDESDINVESGPVDLLYSLKEVRDLYKDRLAQKNIRLVIETEERPPREGYIVLADSQSLTTPILSNIISNAINYSGESYQIHARLKLADENNIVLEIRDMGPGMSKTKIKSILNPLSIENSHTSENGDILNMATVKSYLSLVDARLYIDSRPKELYPNSHGTSMRINFQRSLELKEAG